MKVPWQVTEFKSRYAAGWRCIDFNVAEGLLFAITRVGGALESLIVWVADASFPMGTLPNLLPG